METLMSSMIASGRSENLPPHILFLMTFPITLPSGPCARKPRPLHSRIWTGMTNDMPEQPTAQSAVMRRIPIAVAAVLIGGIAGYVGIYGLGAPKGAGGDPTCRAAVDTAKRIAPLA